MSLSEPVAGGDYTDGYSSASGNVRAEPLKRIAGRKRQSILKLDPSKKSLRIRETKPEKRKTIQKTASPAKPGRKSVPEKAAATEKATSTRKTSSPEKAREKVATCKARPENNKPKGSGGSGKDFVPWCK